VALVLPIAPFIAPLVLEPAVPLVLPVVPVEPAVVSLQSMWTGLAECSFAAPVLLSASLPAFGFLNESQSGLALPLSMERVAELGRRSVLVDFESVACDAWAPVDLLLLVLSAAIAGSVTPRAAARAIVLRNWLRIMKGSSSLNERKSAARRQHTAHEALRGAHGCACWSGRISA